MDNKVFMGIDLGTTGIKIIMIQTDGKIIDKKYIDYPILSPQPGFAEQNPDDWWNGLCSLSKALINRNETIAQRIAGIGIAGQMHTQVYLDSKGKPLGNAITWMDQRCQTLVNEINCSNREYIFKHTSNCATTTYTAPQVMWVKQNQYDLYEKTSKILLAKDYLKYRLTGEMVTDYSDAAGTLLFDVAAKKWSDEMFALFEISRSLMPEVGSSTLVIGKVTEEASRLTGIPAGVPVINGCADHAATSLGAGVNSAGEASVIIGTAGVLSVLSDQPRPDYENGSLCWNYCLDDKWINLGVMQTSGESLNWFKRAFDGNNDDAFETYNCEGSKVAPGSDGLIFLPYLMGERNPHWDANARGVFFGINIEHSKAHFVRAIMEGVSFAFKNNLELVESLGVEIKELRLLGGGSKSLLWREILAQVLNKKITTIQVEETGALGSCILCGLALGVFDDVSQASQDLIRFEEEYYQPVLSATYDKNYRIFKELYPNLKGLYEKLNN